MYREKDTYKENIISYGWERVRTVRRNNVWEFRCAVDYGHLLLKKDGTPKKDVEELVKFAARMEGGWDICYYKGVVAFKNPCERITWIYPKRYFEGRMRDSYKRLDIVRVDKEMMQKFLDGELKYNTGFPTY